MSLNLNSPTNLQLFIEFSFLTDSIYEELKLVHTNINTIQVKDTKTGRLPTNLTLLLPNATILTLKYPTELTWG